MHVESCLALAMQDIYIPVSQSHSPIQPWFGVWKPPKSDRKPILIYGGGSTLDLAKQSALSNLLTIHGETGLPNQIILTPAQNPSNPLWSTMIGDASTPNQIAQGIALAVSVGHFFDQSILHAAIDRAISFCNLQINTGMMSVQHGSKIVSEFKPISHLWIWYLAYAYLRWIAVKSKVSGDLLSLTESLWQRLIADMIASGTPDGHLLCCGPRAWKNVSKKPDGNSKPKPGKVNIKRFPYQSAAADCIFTDICEPCYIQPWPQKRLSGTDMLGARIVRDQIADYKRIIMMRNELPVTVDSIRIARNDDRKRVATWIDGPCSNMTDPGPVWWAQWEEGNLSYGVEDYNVKPESNCYPVSDESKHPKNRQWDTIIDTRNG